MPNSEHKAKFVLSCLLHIKFILTSLLQEWNLLSVNILVWRSSLLKYILSHQIILDRNILVLTELWPYVANRWDCWMDHRLTGRKYTFSTSDIWLAVTQFYDLGTVLCIPRYQIGFIDVKQIECVRPQVKHAAHFGQRLFIYLGYSSVQL